MAQQRTLAPSGPIESSELDSGSAPSMGTRRCVGLKPVSPHSADGMRTEPPVSLPIATAAMPSVTDTAAPLLEPPGMRRPARSQGLAGVPQCGLRPRPENANSLMLVRPTITAPAAIRRSMTGALRTAGGASRNTAEPAVVTSPATSNKSFTETGMPSSGERTMPAARRVSLARAAARARSRLRCVNTRAPSPAASCARAKAASARVSAVVRPVAKSAASDSRVWRSVIF